MSEKPGNRNSIMIREYQKTKNTDIRNNIITINIRLVHKVVNRCYRDAIDPSYDREDLVADGILGLIEAVERFDLSMNLQFSTFAHWWIFKFVSANFKMGTLGLPNHRIKIYKQFNEIMEKAKENGVHLSETEVLKKMGVSQKIFVDTMSQKDTISIDSIVTRDGSNETDRNIHVISKGCSEDQMIAKMDFEIISNLMKAILSEAEIKVLFMRYGVGYDHPHTLQEVAEAMNISYEYVRLLQLRAEATMKKRINKKNMPKWNGAITTNEE